MPVCFVEGPAGLPLDARKALIERVTHAIHHAYPIPDTRVFIREYATEHVGQDGALATKVRPICFLEVPPGIALEARRKLMRELNAAVSEAFQTSDALIFLRAYPLEDVALDGGLQSENVRVAAAMRQMAQAGSAAR